MLFYPKSGSLRKTAASLTNKQSVLVKRGDMWDNGMPLQIGRWGRLVCLPGGRPQVDTYEHEQQACNRLGTTDSVHDHAQLVRCGHNSTKYVAGRGVPWIGTSVCITLGCDSSIRCDCQQPVSDNFAIRQKRYWLTNRVLTQVDNHQTLGRYGFTHRTCVDDAGGVGQLAGEQKQTDANHYDQQQHHKPPGQLTENRHCGDPFCTMVVRGHLEHLVSYWCPRRVIRAADRAAAPPAGRAGRSQSHQPQRCSSDPEPGRG